MQLAEIKEIIECLPKGKTRFYYFKDRYALLLLSLAVNQPVTKRELSGSGIGRLLNKPVVRLALGKYGKGTLSAEVLDAYWPLDYECYLLSLGIWGSKDRRWNQTSRIGYNLVLQLNFSSKHDELYKELIDPDGEFPFEFSCHLISTGKLRTLAWSRLDIDLRNGEALIEEIQNDWVRYALEARKLADRKSETINYCGLEMRKDHFVRYVDSTLRPHVQFWDDAKLSATIWFLREGLGIRTIYHHTHKSGAALKRITYRLPPRSLYTKLPRKSCFSETSKRPCFLAKKGKTLNSKKLLERARFQVVSW